MTPAEIQKFNSELNKLGIYEQGIFTEPYGIPVSIKTPVLYSRTETGGTSGGSCWEDSDPRPYRADPIETRWDALDKFLEENYPLITYLYYRKIEKLIHTNQETKYEYYGNSTDYLIQYILLSELEELLED